MKNVKVGTVETVPGQPGKAEVRGKGLPVSAILDNH